MPDTVDVSPPMAQTAVLVPNNNLKVASRCVGRTVIAFDETGVACSCAREFAAVDPRAAGLDVIFVSKGFSSFQIYELKVAIRRSTSQGRIAETVVCSACEGEWRTR